MNGLGNKMGIQFLVILIFTVGFLHGKAQKSNTKVPAFDSAIVQTYSMINEMDEKYRDEKVVSGYAKLKQNDVEKLIQKLFNSSSYGSSQAVTPIPDADVRFYKNGSTVADVSFCLWTNNVRASFNIKAQLKGDCMGTEIASMCSKGGMSPAFKRYFIGLLIKNHLPVNKEGILNFGK